MIRIDFRMTAGLLAVAIGLAPMGSASAADREHPPARVRAKSPSAEAPLLGRVLVTPSPEQLAKLRLERRMIGLETQTAGTHRAGSIHAESKGAL